MNVKIKLKFFRKIPNKNYIEHVHCLHHVMMVIVKHKKFLIVQNQQGQLLDLNLFDEEKKWKKEEGMKKKLLIRYFQFFYLNFNKFISCIFLCSCHYSV